MTTLKKTYVVLIDTGGDWPDVVFSGSWDEAVALDRTLDDKDVHTSIQAIVALEDISRGRAIEQS